MLNADSPPPHNTFLYNFFPLNRSAGRHVRFSEGNKYFTLDYKHGKATVNKKAQGSGIVYRAYNTSPAFERLTLWQQL